MSANNTPETTAQPIVQSHNWTRRADFFALATWLTLGAWLAAISFLLYGMDFRGYYAAASVLLSGGNPYDYHQVAPVLLRITGEMGNNPYYYPPWFAWLFIPLTALPFQVARIIWMAFNLVIWNLGLWRLGKLVAWPPKGWRLYALYSLVTFSFAWITWRYEQVGILIFVILIALIVSVDRQCWNWAGFWMALLLIKPNITLIVVLGLSLWLMRRRQWRPVLVMFLWLGGLLAAATWITPDWYKPFFEAGFGQGLTVVLDGPENIVALRINTTLLDWLMTLGIAPAWRVPIYGLAVAAGIAAFVAAIWYSESFLQIVSISLLASYALTPYAMQYDNPALVIVIFWALAVCARSQTALRVAIPLAGFIVSVIFWQQNISWAYWMVLGSVALGAWALIAGKRYFKEPVGISSSS